MIQPQDLRIGNWYEYNGIQYQVTAIEFDDVTGHADPPLCYIGEHLIHQINPIPITEEVLVRCGFEKTIRSSWSTGKEVEYAVYKKSDFVFNSLQNAWWYRGKLRNQPLYLHHLQNLYHALTGEELIYKP